jgi:fibronectin type 3 domain-containing protein
MFTSRIHMIVFCASVFAAGSLFAQPTAAPSPTRAISGKEGVYLLLGTQILHSDRPVQGFIGYNLYRKPSGGTSGKINSQPVSRVNTQQEFEKILGHDALGEIAQYLKLGDPDRVWIYTVANSDSTKKLGMVLLNKDFLRATGLLYLDRDVKPGEKYEYAIARVRADGSESQRASLGSIVAGSTPNMPPPKIEVIAASDTGTILRVFLQKSKVLFGYRMFRKFFGGTFSQVGTDIHVASGGQDVSTSFIDTSVPPGGLAYYYAEPFDFVDNTGTPSDTLEVFSYDFNTLATALDIVATGTAGGVRLSWSPLRDGHIIQYLSLERSMDEKKGFEELAALPSQDTAYVDASAIPAVPNYYRLVSVAIDGKTRKYSATVSGLAFNSVPPAPPRGVGARYGRRGIELTWSRNVEPDIAGYYVYRGAGDRDTLLQISPLIRQARTDTMYAFADTSSGVSSYSEYNYFVEAENTSQQKSELSQPVRIKGNILDEAAIPEPPLGVSGYIDRDGIRLMWEDATALNSAVAGYVVYRRKGGERGEPERLAASLVPADWHMYLDGTAQPGVRYEYSVSSVNINNVEGKRSNPFFVMRGNPPLSPPAGVQVRQTREGVKVTWGTSLQQGVVGYNVYRILDGKNRERIASRVSTPEFLDVAARRGTLSRYTVTVVSKDRGESGHSDEAAIRVK